MNNSFIVHLYLIFRYYACAMRMVVMCTLLFGGIFLLLYYSEYIAIFIITSDSMSPVLKARDMVIVCRTCPIRRNDIITFKVKNGHFVTHRVVSIRGAVFITKGDKNTHIDEYRTTLTEVMGKVILHIPISFFWFSPRRKN